MPGSNVTTDSTGRLISAGRITSLAPGEIFVFGSNAGGRHGSGAAKDALDHFGAVYGYGHGLHGQSYAIDTMSGLGVIADEVTTFLAFAFEHPDLTFLVTKIGSGRGQHTPEEIAPYFKGAPENVALPREFVALLSGPAEALPDGAQGEMNSEPAAVGTGGGSTDDAPREELVELLSGEETRRGDVYRLGYVDGLKPTDISAKLNISTSGWVYAYRTQIDAILDGKIPRSRDRQRQAASAIRALLKTAGPDLSKGAQDRLKKHLRDLVAAQADFTAQDDGEVSAEAESDLVDEANLHGKSGIYAFSYGWYLEHPIDQYGGNTLVKVGKAADIGQRLGQHKSGARAHIPEPLVVVRAYEAPAAEIDGIETTFHNLLRTAGHHNPRRPAASGSGVGREWFLTNQDFLDAVAKALGLTTLYIGSSAFVE